MPVQCIENFPAFSIPHVNAVVLRTTDNFAPVRAKGHRANFDTRFRKESYEFPGVCDSRPHLHRGPDSSDNSLNFLAVDLAGFGQTLNGSMFLATFTVNPDAPDGVAQVSVEFADVRDGNNNPLNLTSTPGAVTVTTP